MSVCLSHSIPSFEPGRSGFESSHFQLSTKNKHILFLFYFGLICCLLKASILLKLFVNLIFFYYTCSFGCIVLFIFFLVILNLKCTIISNRRTNLGVHPYSISVYLSFSTNKSASFAISVLYSYEFEFFTFIFSYLYISHDQSSVLIYLEFV